MDSYPCHTISTMLERILAPVANKIRFKPPVGCQTGNSFCRGVGQVSDLPVHGVSDSVWGQIGTPGTRPKGRLWIKRMVL